MVNYDAMHDFGSKTLLNGYVAAANLSTAADLNAALDNIASHPNVAPFISKQLIQHLVKSNPIPGLCDARGPGVSRRAMATCRRSSPRSCSTRKRAPTMRAAAICLRRAPAGTRAIHPGLRARLQRHDDDRQLLHPNPGGHGRRHL